MFQTATMKSVAPNHISALISSALQAMLASFDAVVLLCHADKISGTVAVKLV